MTVLDLIKSSLRLIRVIAPGETPSSTEQSDALLVLNDMLDSWSNERCHIPAIIRTVNNLVGTQGTYTVGSGGDFNIARPLRLDNCGIILNPSNSSTPELPVYVADANEFAAITLKTLVANFPRVVYYRPTFPLGTLDLWPIPNDSLPDLVLYSWVALANFATVNDSVSLAPGISRALRFNFALELAGEYGVEPNQFVIIEADKSKALVKEQNMQDPLLRADPALLYDGRPGRIRAFNVIIGDTI